ncbi:MAG TPA: hypothetical protein PLJ38_02805 [bacterium]|nr:hypothetical protein [bacterium]
MSKISREDLQNIIDNTIVINDHFVKCSLYDFTELHFSVIGKTPFRDDMCIARDGVTVISPQILIAPNAMPSLDELAEEEKVVIEARILFFNNYKLQFSEHPVRRFKKDLKDVAEEISNNYAKNSDINCWAVIKTPDAKLWRLSLIHYIAQKVFNNRGDNTNGFFNNRLSNYF